MPALRSPLGLAFAVLASPLVVQDGAPSNLDVRVARLEERIAAAATALDVSAKMLTLRLAHLNDLTEEMRGRDQLYAQREALEELKARVERVEQWRSALEGDRAGNQRGAEPMIHFLWLIAAACVGVVGTVLANRIIALRK